MGHFHSEKIHQWRDDNPFYLTIVKARGKIKNIAGTEGLFSHQEVPATRLITVPPF